MNLADFHFLRPLWLYALIPLALLLWRLRTTAGERDPWRAVVDAHLLPQLRVDGDGTPRRLPLALLGTGWLLLVLALAGPSWARLPQPVYEAQQFRVIALDLSASMNASDVPPSRLARARFEVLDLLHKAREGQTAMLAYGPEPFVVSPLTTDVDTIAAQVPDLSTDLLPVQGSKRTDLVLSKAGDLLAQAGAPDGEVILVTDDLANPAAAADAARKLRARDYTVSVLGVGTAGGAPVPLDGGGFLKDQNGAIRVPRLDSDALRALASAGGGRYVTASVDDRDIEALMPSAEATSQRATRQQDLKTDQWREEGPWLLLALLPLAALAFRRGWLTPLLLLIFVLPPDAHALGWNDLWSRPDQQAMQAMQGGDPAKAAKLFEQPDWRAAAEYQAGDYAQARQALEAQKGSAADYNLGNTLARQGQLEDAIAAYDRALKANPDDADARHNRDLVERLRAQRQAQQPPPPADQQGQQGQQGQQEQGGQGQEGQQGGSSTESQAQGGKAQSGEQGNQPAQERAGAPGQPEKGERGSSAETAQAASAKPDEASAEASKAGEVGESQAPESPPNEAAAQTQASAEASRAEPAASESSSAAAQSGPASSSAPGLADLLGGSPPNQSASAVQSASPNPEDQQATEQILRRVEDDPAGLLRQRFLLQHLRRSARLP